MRPKEIATTALIIFAAVVLTGFLATASVGANQSKSSTGAVATPVERGKYLVRIMGCNDCHTPWKIGPKGPEMDMTRALTGHPQDMKMPTAPALPPGGPWTMVAAGTMTAWTGPWGVSFTANLTPDKETGLGDWTEEQFIATMKTGRHQGKGRPLLPPMPYFNLGGLSDEDIKSVFAYLQSLPPVRNRVPAPIDPPEGAQQ